MCAINYRKLCNDITGAVIGVLHYQDTKVESLKDSEKPLDVREIHTVGRDRYLNDPEFHARVRSIVGAVLDSIRDNETPYKSTRSTVGERD